MNHCQFRHKGCIDSDLKKNENGVMMCPPCLHIWINKSDLKLRPEWGNYEGG